MNQMNLMNLLLAPRRSFVLSVFLGWQERTKQSESADSWRFSFIWFIRFIKRTNLSLFIHQLMNVMNIDELTYYIRLLFAMYLKREIVGPGLFFSQVHSCSSSSQKKGDEMNKQIKYGLLVLAVLVGFLTLCYGAWWFGRLSAALEPSRTLERPMCAAADMDIRTEPTGYVIGHVAPGEMMWFLGLDLPFARVAYYDGSQWLVGTVTATALEVCDPSSARE